ncbi:MAG: methionine biosynthesis protein MetW [Spirochaetes bacterium]|nr:methionine biosynthesis protein MetW [Spirochaetota bacterium]
MYRHHNKNRSDFEIITPLVKEKSKVLDLGCGDGTLLQKLVNDKKIVARGVEISEEGVASCVDKGLSVFQGDIDEGLADYKNKSFDYVICIQTVQVVRNPKKVIQEMLRVGKKTIVSFPNFGHFMVRFGLLFKGIMPKSKTIPYEWYNTPNIHHLTIKDFRNFCGSLDIKIEKEIPMHNTKARSFSLGKLWANLFAHNGMFIISRK